MFGKFFAEFNTFQNRFTYRQRFLFFAVVFFLFVPAPAYWLLHSQSFFINRTKLETLGNIYQKNLGELLYHVSRHQLVTATSYSSPDEFKDEIALIRKRVHFYLNELVVLQNTASPPQTFYGKGFSNPRTHSINFSLIVQKWKDITQAPVQLSYARNAELHDKLIDEILQHLRQLQYVYGFMLSPEILIHSLSDVTLVRFPEGASLVGRIYSLGLKMRSQIPTEDDLVNLVHYISLLQTNLKTTKEILEKSYVTYDEIFNINRYTLRDARDNLNDYNDNVNQYLNFISNAPTEGVNKKSIVNSLLALGSKALKSNLLVRDTHQIMIDEILSFRKKRLHLKRMFTISLLTACSLLILFFVVFRILSSHLKTVLESIKGLARGKFLKEEFFNTQDEFGQVGISFHSLAQTLTDFVYKLQDLVQQLADSSTQISSAISTQKSNLNDQETSIKQIETTSKQIATNSRYLADTMSELGLGCDQTSPADEAQDLLLGMQGTTSLLTVESTEIMAHLRELQEKVDLTNPLMTFMARVNDKARLLYLNAAIETSEAGEHSKAFADTTLKIKRFADNSATSTSEIQAIIMNMSTDVTSMRQDIFQYLGKFTKGLRQLTSVNQQLSTITEQVEEQTNQFAIVNHMMQEQASEAEKIISSISQIRLEAEKNSSKINHLQEIITELKIAAEQLNNILINLFERGGTHYRPLPKDCVTKTKKGQFLNKKVESHVE